MRAGRPGQGPRGTRGRAAAMGVTIFSGEEPRQAVTRCPRCRKKWWGPVVLDAGYWAASDLAIRERKISQGCGWRLSPPQSPLPAFLLSYRPDQV